MDFKVTEDTIIGDIMDADETTAEYFLEMGMHCLFCPSSRGETVAQACDSTAGARIAKSDLQIIRRRLIN